VPRSTDEEQEKAMDDFSRRMEKTMNDVEQEGYQITNASMMPQLGYIIVGQLPRPMPAQHPLAPYTASASGPTALNSEIHQVLAVANDQAEGISDDLLLRGKYYEVFNEHFVGRPVADIKRAADDVQSYLHNSVVHMPNSPVKTDMVRSLALAHDTLEMLIQERTS
jgi:hypothetical protein